MQEVARQTFCTGYWPVTSLHHDFADIIREFNRILNRQSFDQEGLIVQKVRIQIQLLFILLDKHLSTIETRHG